MADEYFLLPSKYGEYEMGSIFQCVEESYVDLDTDTKPIYDFNASKQWNKISLLEKNWLLKKTLTERLVCNRCNIFTRISQLNVDQDCFYHTENRNFNCKIKEIEDGEEELKYLIILEDGQEKNVLLEDIQLYSDANSQEMEDIMKLLVAHRGDIQMIDGNKRSVISMVYKLRNKSYFQMLLKTDVILDITKENIQSLLRSIVDENRLTVLELVLNKCNIGQNNNAFLVKLAIEALRNGSNELLGVIFKFIQNIDPLENGETFLTNLFREGISQEMITNVVEMSLFNVNVPSNTAATALTLASKNLWVGLVTTLLKHGADAYYNRHKAMGMTFEAERDHPEKEADATNIRNLLSAFQPTDLEKNVVIPPGSVNTTVAIGEPLDALEEIVLEIMRLLVTQQGNILVLNESNSSVLTLSYNFPNKRFFNIFVHDYRDDFDVMTNAVGQSLLSQMVIDKEMAILKVVLDKCVHADKYETFLLNVALATLKKGIDNHYKMIVEKCVNKDRETKTNEIFLTSCFKENIEEKRICDVILSKFFDINKENTLKETALILACERLMKDVVRTLLENGGDASFNFYAAVDTVVDEGKKLDNAEERKLSKKAILDIICGKVDKNKVVEKLHLLENGCVDFNKILKVQTVEVKFCIGDQVLMNLKINEIVEVLTGEVKWLGLVDGEDCVGVNLDEAHYIGMNGVINADTRFECTPGHGALIPIGNVQLNLDANNVHFLDNNILDPHKYIKCHENWTQVIPKKNDFKRDDVVCAKVMDGDKEVKLKGVLRWFGTVTNVPAGIIELEKPHANGTNGLFWKTQLIRCAENRAIFIKAEHIEKYIYKKEEIPLHSRIFPLLDINSPVIYYAEKDDGLHDLYGTIRWTGIDINQMYMYGVELEEIYDYGTDGIFNGQRLFNCGERRGIVASINVVAPRNNIEVPQETQPSRDLEEVRYCTPVNLARKYGIQGHKNSSFLDSLLFSLFSTSDALDFMIYKQNDDKNNIRNIISSKVVYPLRAFGFVSFHKTDELRQEIMNWKPKYGDMMDHETNLENVAPVFKKLCRGDPFLSLLRKKTVLKEMFLNIDKIPDETISCQQLLNIHMVEKGLVFDKIPTCLIINVPMERKKTSIVLPSNLVEISKLCNNTLKICSQCKDTASYQCKRCIRKEKCIRRSLFCTNHKCQHENIAKCRTSEFGSKSDIPMHLLAVICNNEGHFVSYVKDDEKNDKWIFFDDDIMSNPVSPTTTPVKELPSFLEKSYDEMANDLKGINEGHLHRITMNSCVFIYLNSTKTCY